MVAKRTRSGKLSLSLAISERNRLFGCCCNFLEDNSLKSYGKSEADIMRQLHFYTINQFYTRTNFQLQLAGVNKIVVTIAEAIALMWMLRNYTDMEVINMKSELHKKLS